MHQCQLLITAPIPPSLCPGNLVRDAEAFEQARDFRIRTAAEGSRMLLNVIDVAADVCPWWWNAGVAARPVG
jgi:hypothetical protein